MTTEDDNPRILRIYRDAFKDVPLLPDERAILQMAATHVRRRRGVLRASMFCCGVVGFSGALLLTQNHANPPPRVDSTGFGLIEGITYSYLTDPEFVDRDRPGNIEGAHSL